MDKVYQVFVSSTYADLADERRHVSETLAKAGYIPAGMELFPATDQQQLEFIKRVIDRCDYYVVIVGGRYGSLADDNISFTEKEYEYAVERSIPVLAFLHRHPEKIEVGKTDRSEKQARKLATFRDRLSRARIVDFWSDPHELCTKVVIAVAQSVNLSPGIGWIRGDQAVDPKVLQELERLRIEAAELREKLARTAESDVAFPSDIAGPDELFVYDLVVKTYETGEAGQRNLVDKRTLQVAPTLRDVFISLSEAILMERSEWALREHAGHAVAKLSGMTIEKHMVYELDQNIVRSMRHQLEALGLIEAIGRSSSSGTTSIYWTMTDKGRKYSAHALAKRATVSGIVGKD